MRAPRCCHRRIRISQIISYFIMGGGKIAKRCIQQSTSHCRARAHIHTRTYVLYLLRLKQTDIRAAMLCSCSATTSHLVDPANFCWALCRVFELNARARAGGRLNVFMHSKFQRTSVCGRQPSLPLSSTLCVNSPQLSFVAL